MKQLPEPSPIFETFWRFAAERHHVYGQRVMGLAQPWTDDAIISLYRFTNVFRVADRVSQYLIRHVIYEGDQDAKEIVFRVLLFKLFNNIEIWNLLEQELGTPTFAVFDLSEVVQILTAARSEGRSVYSPAYIVPPVPGWGTPKHAGHLHLVVDLINGGFAEKVTSTKTLEQLFFVLREVCGIGDFLAYQLAIDLCYSTVANHDEDEFVAAGPGARDGLSKIFFGMDQRCAAEVIRLLTDQQERWFEHFALPAVHLAGRRLHLIDVQNLLCEVGKYARVAYPEYRGISGRTRIKQAFHAHGALPPLFLPPKWKCECS